MTDEKYSRENVTIFYKIGNASLFMFFYEQTERYLVNTAMMFQKKNVFHIPAEQQDPQINKFSSAPWK